MQNSRNYTWKYKYKCTMYFIPYTRDIKLLQMNWHVWDTRFVGYYFHFVGCSSGHFYRPSVVSLRFKYLTLVLTPLYYGLLCLWKAARELREKGRKEMKIPFNSNFILGFNNYSFSGKFFLKPIVAPPRQGIKIY